MRNRLLSRRGGKTITISAVYSSRFNDEQRAKLSRAKSAIVAYPWRVARPAEISYAEIRHAPRAPGETERDVEVRERGRETALLTVSRGSDRVNQSH